MKNLIEQFPLHLSTASGFDYSPFNSLNNSYRQVVISGLGGSGIGASIVQDLLSGTAKVPIIINKTYHLPAFANHETLFIAVSYSGNTEETLSALEMALTKNCQIAGISSGGRLLALGNEKSFPVLQIPGGNPPRSMLGYSLIGLLGILGTMGIVDFNSIKQAISTFSASLENDLLSDIQSQTQVLAKSISDKIPVVYASTGTAAIATRWRQQLNENAKMPGWDGEVPEMNHNELVGWAGGDKNFAVLMLKTAFDYVRNQKRNALAASKLSEITNVYEIEAIGTTHFEQLLYLIHYGDWLSYYLSEIRQVDIMDIAIIDFLKSSLEKFDAK
jgi:glucose/mannose-6-phosphate isomerase